MSQEENERKNIIYQATKLKVKNQDDLERLLNAASEENNRTAFLAFVDLQNKIEIYSNLYNKDIFSQIPQKTKKPRKKKNKNTHSNPNLPNHPHATSNISTVSSPAIYANYPNQANIPNPHYQQAYDPSNPAPQQPQFVTYFQQHPGGQQGFTQYGNQPFAAPNQYQPATNQQAQYQPFQIAPNQVNNNQQPFQAATNQQQQFQQFQAAPNQLGAANQQAILTNNQFQAIPNQQAFQIAPNQAMNQQQPFQPVQNQPQTIYVYQYPGQQQQDATGAAAVAQPYGYPQYQLQQPFSMQVQQPGAVQQGFQPQAVLQQQGAAPNLQQGFSQLIPNVQGHNPNPNHLFANERTEEVKFEEEHQRYLNQNGIIAKISETYEVAVHFVGTAPQFTSVSHSSVQGNIQAAKEELLKERRKLLDGNYPLNMKNMKITETVRKKIIKKLEEHFPSNQITIASDPANKFNKKKNKNANNFKKWEIRFVGTAEENKEILKIIKNVTKISTIVIEIDRLQIKQMKASKYVLPNNESMLVLMHEDKSTLEIFTIFPELVDKATIQQHINKTLKIHEELDFGQCYVNRKGLMEFINAADENDDEQEQSMFSYLNSIRLFNLSSLSLPRVEVIEQIPKNLVALHDVKQYLKHSKISKDAEKIGVSYSFNEAAAPSPAPGNASPQAGKQANNRGKHKILTFVGTKDKLDEFKTTKSYKTLKGIIGVELNKIIPWTLQRIWDDNEIEEIITELDILVVEATKYNKPPKNQPWNKNNKQQNKKTKFLYGSVEQIRKFTGKIRKIIKEKEYVVENKSFSQLNPQEWSTLKNRLLTAGAKEKKEIEEKFGVSIVIVKGNNDTNREIQFTGKQSDVDTVFDYLESSQKKSSISVPINNKFLLQILKKKDAQSSFCKILSSSCSGYSFKFVGKMKAISVTGGSKEIENTQKQVQNHLLALESRITGQTFKISRLELDILKETSENKILKIANETGTWIDLPEIQVKSFIKYRNAYGLKNASTILIEIEKNDITKKRVEAIVNAANEELKHTGGVAKAILQAAGPQLQNYCKNHVTTYGLVSTTQCTVSPAYNLTQSNQIQFIIHAVGPKWNPDDEGQVKEQLIRTYLNLFGKCELQGIQNVALPLISSKIFGFPANVACECAQIALERYIDAKQQPKAGKSLKTITFVDIDANLITELTSLFENTFGQSNRSREAKENEMQAQKDAEPPKYTFKWEDDKGTYTEYEELDQYKLSEAIDAGQTKVDLAIDNTKYRSGAKYTVDFSTMIQTNNQTNFQRKIIKQTNDAYFKYIFNFSSLAATPKSTVPAAESENEKSKDLEISVHGLEDSCDEAIKQIEALLKKKKVSKSIPADGLAVQTVKNEYENLYNVFIEKAIGNQISITGSKENVTKVIEQILINSTSKRGDNFPKEWKEPHDSFQLVPLSEFVNKHEYHRVLSKLRETLPTIQILKMERIQNPTIWRKFNSERGFVKETLGKEPAELTLFHGTRNLEPSEIYQGEIGFDMAHSSTGMWGRGCYFAVNASYSNNYAHENASKHKQILLATVIIGESEERQADSKIIRPNVKPTNLQSGKNKNERYNSIKGNTNGSDVFIVYDNGRAYPTHLITYFLKESQ